MIFSSKLFKFGKGNNLSLFMKTPEKINIYYFKDGILKKELSVTNHGLTLNSENINLPYNEVIEFDNFLITRIEKTIGITTAYE